MSLRTRTWSLLAAGLVTLTLTGAPAIAAEPSADDPVATVNAVLDTLIAKDFGGIAPLVCEQYREAVATRFDLTASFADMPEGVDVDALFAGMTLTADPREVTLVSNDGAAAVVSVAATLHIAIDEAAARAFVRQIVLSQFQAQPSASPGASMSPEALDAVIDMFMPQLTEQFAEGQDLTEDVEMTFENGAWLVCEAFGDEAAPSASPGAVASPGTMPSPGAIPSPSAVPAA